MAFFEDLLASVLPTVSYADSEEEEEEQVEESSEESQESEEGSSEDAEEGGDDDEDDEDEDEDDEDEEEEADPYDKLRDECSKTGECVKYVHHYQECVERVTKSQEDPGYAELAYKEDCVEEFFHLQHCLNDCAAPRLFYKLK